MWGDFEAIPEHSMAAEQGGEVKSVLQQGGFLGRDTERLFPYGIYTIPEISMVRLPSLPPSLFPLLPLLRSHPRWNLDGHLLPSPSSFRRSARRKSS
jgi:hypothetical protein